MTSTENSLSHISNVFAEFSITLPEIIKRDISQVQEPLTIFVPSAEEVSSQDGGKTVISGNSQDNEKTDIFKSKDNTEPKDKYINHGQEHIFVDNTWNQVDPTIKATQEIWNQLDSTVKATQEVKNSVEQTIPTDTPLEKDQDPKLFKEKVVKNKVVKDKVIKAKVMQDDEDTVSNSDLKQIPLKWSKKQTIVLCAAIGGALGLSGLGFLLIVLLRKSSNCDSMYKSKFQNDSENLKEMGESSFRGPTFEKNDSIDSEDFSSVDSEPKALRDSLNEQISSLETEHLNEEKTQEQKTEETVDYDPKISSISPEISPTSPENKYFRQTCNKYQGFRRVTSRNDFTGSVNSNANYQGMRRSLVSQGSVISARQSQCMSPRYSKNSDLYFLPQSRSIRQNSRYPGPPPISIDRRASLYCASPAAAPLGPPGYPAYGYPPMYPQNYSLGYPPVSQYLPAPVYQRPRSSVYKRFDSSQQFSRYGPIQDPELLARALRNHM